MSSPVILPRERLSALPRVWTAQLGTVKFPSLLVLVVDMSIQMCLGAKFLPAAWMSAFVGSLVVSPVMTKICQRVILLDILPGLT